MIKSISYSQDEILQSIIDLHCKEGFEVDATYGNGSFYKKINKPLYCYDIEPLSDNVVKASSDNLPLSVSSVNSIVFDPPFLCDLKKGRKEKSIMGKRFSGYDRFSDLEKHYAKTINEAARVLKKKGLLIFKCQDTVHWHKLRSIHTFVITECENNGFRVKDMFILLAKNRMPLKASKHGKQTQRHARVYHSYFIVFEKISKYKL